MKYQRIELNPAIMTGKPVIRGTRIPVETILRKLGAAVAPEAILADYPATAFGGSSCSASLRGGKATADRSRPPDR